MATVTTESRPDVVELVRQYQAGLWRYLRYLGCDSAQAEDLVQETFLTVLRKGFEDRGPAATHAWLRTVARNLFLMSVRKSDRSPVIENPDLADEVWASVARDDGGNASLDALSDCLETLDGKASKAIRLRYEQNHSRAQMAGALGMTEEGIKTLLRRTREILRRCVERRIER